jgi:hypothetical protein
VYDIPPPRMLTATPAAMPPDVGRKLVRGHRLVYGHPCLATSSEKSNK